MSEAKVNADTAISGGSSDPTFSQGAKQSDSVKAPEKTEEIQWGIGVACEDPVLVISKCNEACFVEKKTPDNDPRAQLERDLVTLTIMQLRSKYKGEADSHRNMKARSKAKGVGVPTEFETFKDFLSHVGPKPTSTATLDRIDNDDPEYAPGKVRWADKQTQNSNKGDSLIFTCLSNNRSYTALQLAKQQGVEPATIRSRRRRGWTDAEIIAAKRANAAVAKPVAKERSSEVNTSRRHSAQQILFERNRAEIEHSRKEYGVEPFICTPREFQEICPEFGGDAWLRKSEQVFLRTGLPRYWKKYAPHIRFAALRARLETL